MPQPFFSSSSSKSKSFSSASSTPSSSASSPSKPKNTVITSRIHRNEKQDIANNNNNKNTEVYEQDAWRRQLQIQELLQALRPSKQSPSKQSKQSLQSQQLQRQQEEASLFQIDMGNEASSTAASGSGNPNDDGVTSKSNNNNNNINNHTVDDAPWSPTRNLQSAAASSSSSAAALTVASPRKSKQQPKQKQQPKRGRRFARRMGGGGSISSANSKEPSSPSLAAADRESSTSASSLLYDDDDDDDDAYSPEQVFEKHLKAAAAADASSPSTPSTPSPSTPTPRTSFDENTERTRASPEQQPLHPQPQLHQQQQQHARLRQPLLGRHHARRHSSTSSSFSSSSRSLHSTSSSHHYEHPHSPLHNVKDARSIRSISQEDEYNVLPVVLQSIPSMDPSIVNNYEKEEEEEEDDGNHHHLDMGPILGWQSDSVHTLSQFLDARQEQQDDEEEENEDNDKVNHIVSGDDKDEVESALTQSPVSHSKSLLQHHLAQQPQLQDGEDDDDDDILLPRESFVTTTAYDNDHANQAAASWSDQDNDEQDQDDNDEGEEAERHAYYQFDQAQPQPQHETIRPSWSGGGNGDAAAQDEGGGGIGGQVGVAAVRSVMTGVVHPKVGPQQVSPPTSPTQAPTPSPTPYYDNDNNDGHRPAVQINATDRHFLAMANLNDEQDNNEDDHHDASPTEKLSPAHDDNPASQHQHHHEFPSSSLDLPNPNNNPLLEGWIARRGSSVGGNGNHHNNNDDDDDSTNVNFHTSYQDESEHTELSKVKDEDDDVENADEKADNTDIVEVDDHHDDEKIIALSIPGEGAIMSTRAASTDDSMIQHARSLDNVVMAPGPFPQPGFPAPSPIATHVHRSRSLDDIVISPKASERVRAAMMAGTFSYHVTSAQDDDDDNDNGQANAIFHAEVSTPNATEIMLDESSTVEQAVEKLATLDLIDVDDSDDAEEDPNDNDDNDSNENHDDDAIVNANDAPASPVRQHTSEEATSAEKGEGTPPSSMSPMQAEGVSQAFDTVRQNLNDSLAAFLDEAKDDEASSKASSVAAANGGNKDDHQDMKSMAEVESVNSSNLSASAAAAIPRGQLKLPTLIMPEGNNEENIVDAGDGTNSGADESNFVFHATDMATPRAAELLGESSFASNSGQVSNHDGATETVTFERNENTVQSKPQSYMSDMNEKEPIHSDDPKKSDNHADSEEVVPEAIVSSEASGSVHESEATEKDAVEAKDSGSMEVHENPDGGLPASPVSTEQVEESASVVAETEPSAPASDEEMQYEQIASLEYNATTTDDLDAQHQSAVSHAVALLPNEAETINEEVSTDVLEESPADETPACASGIEMETPSETPDVSSIPQPALDRDAGKTDVPVADFLPAHVVEALSKGDSGEVRETDGADSTQQKELPLAADKESTVDAATIDSWKRVVDEARSKMVHVTSTLSEDEPEETVMERDGEANNKKAETEAGERATASSIDTENAKTTSTETSSLQEHPNSQEDYTSSAQQVVPSPSTNRDTTAHVNSSSPTGSSRGAVPDRVDVPVSSQEDGFDSHEAECPMTSPPGSLEPLPLTDLDRHVEASSESVVKENSSPSSIECTTGRSESPVRESSGEEHSKIPPSSSDTASPLEELDATSSPPSWPIPLSPSLSTFDTNEKCESNDGTGPEQSFGNQDSRPPKAENTESRISNEAQQQAPANDTVRDPFKKGPDVSKPALLPASSSAESTMSSSHQESTVFDMPRPKNHDVLMQHASSFLTTPSDFARHSSQQTNSPSGNVSLAESSITEATHPTYQDCHYFSPTRQISSNRVAPMSVGATRYQPKSIKDLVRRDLRSSNENVVERALQQITIDCFYDQSARSMIARVGGLLAVISAMEDHSSNPLIQIAACQALEKLSLDADNERAVAELGGIDCILGAMMTHFGNVRLQEAAWSALQNLTCSNAYSEMPMDTTDDGMGVLVRSFQQHASHSNVAMHASATLANLCIPNEVRTDHLIKADGVVTIAKALQEHWANRSARNEISHSLERLCEGIAIQSEDT